MKKNILLALVLLLTCGYASAEDWQEIDSRPHNVRVYVDMDSIRTGRNDHELLYAARYTVPGETEKLIYLRTDTKTNQLGIIDVDEVANTEYRPIRKLTNPRAFMKDIDESFFLKPLHDYISALSMNEDFIKNSNGVYWLYKAKQNGSGSNYVNVNYKGSYTSTPSERLNIEITDNPTAIKDEFITYSNTDNAPNEAISNYLSLTCKQINANWMPPVTSVDRRTIVNVSINNKGQLEYYDMVESSGDTKTDDSVLQALKSAQPYTKLPANNVHSMLFRFVFERTPYGHIVVY